MDRVRLGSTFRAIRIELRLRQTDIGARAGVSQQTVSAIECGRFGTLSIDTLSRVAAELQADFSATLRWRGPKLARLLDRRHAWLQDQVIRLIAGRGWEVVAEESFNEFGERGSVDILAWRPDRRALLLVEIKTEIVDLQETLRTMDMKARVVPGIVRRTRGWRAQTVASVLVLPSGNAHRRAVAQHAALLAAALPARTLEIRQWLSRPAGALRGIWFFPYTRGGGALDHAGASRRVRASRRRTGRPAAGSGVTDAAAARPVQAAGTANAVDATSASVESGRI